MSSHQRQELDRTQDSLFRQLSPLYHHHSASEQASVIYRLPFGLHAAAVPQQAGQA
jgi:hypothetical protein